MDRRTMLKATGSAAALSILGGIPLAKAGEAGKLKKSQKKKILVIGAHPDDPETGAGGTICLLKEAGLSCRIITGQTAGQGTDLGHAWNIVRIGDVYYNLDVTWASSWGREAFFLECNESFADHVRDPEFDTAEFNARYPMAQADYAEE